MNFEESLETEYFTITLDGDGRGFHVRIADSIKSNPHHQALKRYFKKLVDSGITKYNVDHIGGKGRDRTLQLGRGNRRLDLVYMRDGILYECELKTPYECGLDRTWIQVREQAKHCDRLTLLVARSEITNVENIIKMVKIENVFVEPYD